MLTLVFVLGLVLLYLHTYVHFYVNPLNELMTLNDVYRQELTSQLYSKLPILFHAKTIRRDPEIRCVPSVQREGYVIYETLYEPVSLLEPSVKFFPSSKVYQFAEQATQATEAQDPAETKPETSQADTSQVETKPFLVETHLACRTFYRIHTGKYKVTCIHPKYTDHFTRGIKEPSFIHEHPQMLHLELHQDSILFLPNYWYVLLEPIVPGQIEVIQYSTPLNLLNFAYDQLMDVFKLA